MLTVNSPHKYITQKVLDQCFIDGRTTYVDKVYTGNGFTTAFLNDDSIPQGKVNILLVPNRGVVQDKEDVYRKSTGKNVSFFYYGGSYDSKEPLDFYMMDIGIFVIDSFFRRIKEIANYKDKVHRILIDESHTVESAGSYRDTLKTFHYKLADFFPTTTISYVTASPNMFSQVDIKINNLVKREKITIDVTQDILSTIEKAKNSLKAGNRVLLCTQETKIISQFYKRVRNKKGMYLKYNKIYLGDKIKDKLARDCVLSPDPDNKLVIISSSGFEGLDLMEGKYDIYFFENRSQRHTTFTRANLYQAISRPRLGAINVTYCRMERVTNRIPKGNRIKINKFLSNKNFSRESKMSRKIDKIVKDKKTGKYKLLRKQPNHFVDFLLFHNDNVIVDDIAINNEMEAIAYDNIDVNNKFWRERGISFNLLDEKRMRLGRKNTKSIEDQKEYLKLNEAVITEWDLYGEDWNIPLKVVDTKNSKDIPFDLEEYRDRIELYRIQKDYNGKWEPWESFLKVEEIIMSEYGFEELCKKIEKSYKENPKLTRREIDYKLKEFKEKSEFKVMRNLLVMANKRVDYVKNVILYRDYNATTEINMESIKIIAEAVGRTVEEYDIRSCNARILWALDGLPLPDNIYGPNKVNKKKINLLINDTHYESKIDPIASLYGRKPISSPKYKFLINKTRQMEFFGFPLSVIERITAITKEGYSGDVFNYLARHERNIINILMGQLDDEKNNGVVRRHDSVLIFDNKQKMDFLNDFEYEGEKGWFRPLKNSENMSRSWREIENPPRSRHGNRLF